MFACGFTDYRPWRRVVAFPKYACREKWKSRQETATVVFLPQSLFSDSITGTMSLIRWIAVCCFFLFLLCVCSWEKEYWLVHYNLLWDWLEKKLSLRIRRRTAAAAVKGDMFRTGQRVIHPKEEKCSINLGQTRTHKVCTEHQPPSSWKVDEIWQRLGGSNIKSLPRVTVVLARFLERDAGQRIRPERWGET